MRIHGSLHQFLDEPVAGAAVAAGQRVQYGATGAVTGVDAGPVNAETPQAMTAAPSPELNAFDRLAEVRRMLDTSALGRLEQLARGLDDIYGTGFADPLRRAITDLGELINTARITLSRATRAAAERVDQLAGAVDQWAADEARTRHVNEALVGRLEQSERDAAAIAVAANAYDDAVDRATRILAPLVADLPDQWAAPVAEVNSLLLAARATARQPADVDTCLVSREALYQALGALALPPQEWAGPEANSADCAPIAERIIATIDPLLRPTPPGARQSAPSRPPRPAGADGAR